MRPYAYEICIWLTGLTMGKQVTNRSYQGISRDFLGKLKTEPYIHFVCRYITTRSGALFTYPGTPNFKLSPVTGGFYDPRTEPFYRTPASGGVVVFTSPRLDFGGAGHVVTLSAPVLNPEDVAAVASMDITLGFIWKMVLRIVPDCSRGFRQVLPLFDS